MEKQPKNYDEKTGTGYRIEGNKVILYTSKSVVRDHNKVNVINKRFWKHVSELTELQKKQIGL